ncbi:glycosyltransferase family 4 protein [Rhodovibrio salinarum]|uniref:glycosyltransferase family 4 protein n=1 Tax=Rhodovibrio salinarum TaxID=1087 RepID=UPI0004850FA8|nr:glycosyltransferase family 4 protein [Rhodovibrio salinarum]
MTARRLAFVWAQLAPYHLDRLDALACVGFKVTGVAVAQTSHRYPWRPGQEGSGWDRHTLVPGMPLEAVSERMRTRELLATLRAVRPDLLFLCNWPRPHVLAAALWARRAGIPSVVMCDSTADDRPQRRWRTRIKRALLASYCGGLAAADRSAAYLAALGVPASAIATGYDRLSVARLRTLAAAPTEDAPEPGFVVIARLAPEKNVAGALSAYAHYRVLCQAAGRVPAALTILGDGPLRAELETSAAGLPGVRFAGFVASDAVARTLARAQALLLPSWREPWGLVVNEAVALGVPVLASTRVGAAETLVRDGVSGHLLAPDDPAGWAQAMARLTAAPEYRARLAAGSAALAPRADVGGFVDGVGWLAERLT